MVFRSTKLKPRPRCNYTHFPSPEEEIENLPPFDDAGFQLVFLCDDCGKKLSDSKTFARRLCEECKDRGDEIFSISPFSLLE